ncbi:MAG: LptF/LptG family permease [Flavobacteriaceae bacterium]|nr:LptF/LptG family permease [Flavobacteriaceae bacterium]
MKILDRYILKKYIGTFFVLILLFIPIGIMVDLSEKIDKFKAKDVPLDETILYYIDFTWYFANLLYPIFLFLSIIWFTSKLASNSEVIAILSSGISFRRFFRPFIVGATFICLLAFLVSMYIAPSASAGYNEFRYKYFVRNPERNTQEVFQQINEKEYIYVSNYDPIRQSADNFVLTHFEGNELKFKIKASSIRWQKEDSLFRLTKFNRRKFTQNGELYYQETLKDTIFDFSVDDLAPVNYVAETLPLGRLIRFIQFERDRGSPLLNRHVLNLHKRWSLPISVFVLTFIAVAVASKKRRGGTGFNLALGVTLGFLFVFFEKVLGVLVAKSTFSPIIAAWFPIFLFAIIGVYLLRKTSS